MNNPCFVFRDNQSVLWNTTVPESMLKKKTSSVAYHFVRKGVSRDEWRTTYITTTENPADLMTKYLAREKIDCCLATMCQKRQAGRAEMGLSMQRKGTAHSNPTAP